MASPLNNPALLAFAGNLLSQANGPGPGFGSTFGGALSNLGQVQMLQQLQERQRQQDLLAATEKSINIRAALGELDAQQRSKQVDSEQQARVQAFGASLPPEHQQLFAADPAGYIDWYQKNQLPQEQTPLTQDQILDNTRADARLAFEREKFSSQQGLAREKFTAEQAGGGEQTAAMRMRTQKIADLMALQDLNQADATAIVDGQVQAVTDPVRGKSVLVNRATGETKPIETPRRKIEPLGDGQGGAISLDDLAAEVGAIPFAKDFISKTVGQFYPGLVDEARTKAATQLGFIQQHAVMAFSTSSRPPVIEQKAIRELFPQKGIYDSSEHARQQLNHLRDLTAYLHDTYMGEVESGSLPIEVENENILKMAQLKQLNKMLPDQAQPLQQAPAQQPPQRQTSGRAPRPRNANEALKQEMATRKSIKKMTDDDLNGMSLEELEALRERMAR